MVSWEAFHSVFIFSNDLYSGKSLVTFGIFQMIMKKKHCIAFFRPIIEESSFRIKDDHIYAGISNFQLKISYYEAFSFTKKEAIFLYNYGGKLRIYDHIFTKHKELEENFDFVLVEGLDCSNNTQQIEMNTEVAKHLHSPIILVINGANKKINTIYDHIMCQHINFIMLIINKTLIPFQLLQLYLNRFFPTNVVVFTIPPDEMLDKPTLIEIKKSLDAELIIGNKYDLNKISMKYIVYSIECNHSLIHLDFNEDFLIITQGDRIDLIFATLIANISSTSGAVSAMMLIGGILPDNTFLHLMKGLPNFIPIFAVYCDSLETTQRVVDIKPRISPQIIVKIQQSLNLFEEYVDNPLIFDKITFLKYNYISPQKFLYNILKQSKIAQKHLVLPEGIEERILLAASLFTKEGLGKVTVLGKTKKIMDKVNNLGIYWDPERIALLDTGSSKIYEDFYRTLYHLRKEKGLQLTDAKICMLDMSYFGTMIVYKGLADGMVSGAENTTANTIRPALQFIKTRTDINTVSSIFFMILSDRVLVYGDCAIVTDPTAEQLADITIVSAKTSEDLGFDPKVALLSYSSANSGSGKQVEKVRRATEIVKNRAPQLLIEGPIQYDAAVDHLVGKKKIPHSSVEGCANVFIFPDLNTGNNTYKAVQKETKSGAIGPIVQGLNKPINDLSRGASVEDIYRALLITSIQSLRN